MRLAAKIPAVRIAYGLVFVMAVVYAFITLRGPGGIPAMLEKRQEVRELDAENNQLLLQNQDRRERIEALLKDREQQEIEIRRRLKLVKPKEKVYILGE